MKTNASTLPAPASIWSRLISAYFNRPSAAIFAFCIAALVVAFAVKSEIGFWLGLAPAALLFATVFNLLEHLTRAIDDQRKFVATVLAGFCLAGGAALAFDVMVLLIELSFLL